MYHGIIESGWRTGIYDVRPHRYQHPYLVVHRPTRTVLGCWTRAEARRTLADVKAGNPAR